MTSLLPRVAVIQPDVAPGNTATDAVPAARRHHRVGTTMAAAVGHIHLRVPEPRPAFPHLEPTYFEVARMAREMNHL